MTTYKKALKKYKNEEILNMYRDSKIELNDKEWNNLHKRIYKENMMIQGIEISTIIVFVICLITIIFVAANIKPSNFERIKECNQKMNHKCTKYEIEKGEYNGKQY